RRAIAQLGDEVAQRRHEALPRHALREAEGLAPLRERALAGKQLVEALVRRGVGVRLRRRRPDAVAALDLVGVRELLACEHAGVRAQPVHLIAQPAVVELAQERVALGDERVRLLWWL